MSTRSSRLATELRARAMSHLPRMRPFALEALDGQTEESDPDQAQCCRLRHRLGPDLKVILREPARRSGFKPAREILGETIQHGFFPDVDECGDQKVSALRECLIDRAADDAQNVQAGLPGASNRRVAPAGSNWTVIVRASIAPSFRITCTCSPPSSTNVIPTV